MTIGPTGDAEGFEPAEPACARCGAAVPRWQQICANCGLRVRSREEAAREELAHIGYLEAQIPWLLRRGLLNSQSASQIENEYRSRKVSLEQLVSAGAATPKRSNPSISRRTGRPDVPEFDLEQHSDPVVPPSNRQLPLALPLHPAAEEPISPTPVPPPAPPTDAVTAYGWSLPEEVGAEPLAPEPTPEKEPERAAASSQPPALRVVSRAAFQSEAPPAQSPKSGPSSSQANPEDLRTFFEAHGLKLIFALATLLVLYALKNLVAWEAVGAVAVRLVPALLIGLTAMFAAFGARTRSENPWAAYIFHAMACVLAACDVGALNRFWLEPIHAALPLRPALLLSCGAGTGFGCLLLARIRRVPYLHLVQAGAMATLYAVLQVVRSLVWHVHDFRADPLALFGAAFLLPSAAEFLAAGGWRLPGLNGAGSRETADTANDSASADPLESGAGAWRAAHALWANLFAASILLFFTLNVLLSGRVSPYEMSAVLLLAGIVYAVGAQTLGQPRAAYIAGALAGCSAVTWLAGAPPTQWNLFGYLLLAAAIGALALLAYNRRQAGPDLEALELAWDRVARLMLAAAVTAMALQLAAPWSQAHAWPPASDSITLAAQGLISGILLLLIGRYQFRSEYAYGAAVAWSGALVGALEAAHAEHGAYAVGFALYGAALYAVSAWLRRVASAPPGMAVTPDPAASVPHSAPPVKQSSVSADAFARSGKAAALIAVLCAAALTRGSVQVNWLWAAITLTLGSTLFAAAAQQESSTTSSYLSLGFLAYASALIMWRLAPGLTLADRLAPFNIGSALAGLVLTLRAVTRRAPAAAGAPDLPPDSPWRDSPGTAALAGAIVALSSLLPAAISSISARPISAVWIAIAALLVFASRAKPASDTVRTAAAVLATLSGLLFGAMIAGLVGPPAGWTPSAGLRASAGWLAQAWLTWVAGGILSRREATRAWAQDAIQNGLVAGGLAGAACTLAACTCHGPLSAAGVSGLMLGAFLLAAAERLRSESEPAQGLSLAVIALAAAGHAALVFAHAAYAETAWTLFALTAAASYFALARKERSVRTAYLTLVPLVVGFTLFAVWKRLMVSGAHTGAFDPRTVLSDILIANPLWMVGAGVAAGLYLMAAHRLQRREFSAMGGAVAIAGYSHSLIFLFNPPADWFPFLVLPFVGLLYLAGILCADRAPTVGDPLRQTALAAAGLAALFVTVRTLASLTPVSPGSMLPTASAVATVFALMTFETYRTAARWPRVATLALVGMVAACCWHHRVPGTPFPASLWCGFALVASASYFLIASNEKRADLSQLALWPLLLGYGLFAVWRVQGGLGALDEAIANGLVALGGAVAAAAYFRAARTGRDPVFTYLAAGFAVCTWAHLIGLRPGWAPDWYLLALAPAPLALFLCGALAFSGHDYLRAPMRAVGLIVVGGSALFVTGRVTAGLGVTGADSLVPGGLLTACAFALAAAETYITSAAAPRVGSFAALALAGLVFQAHTHSGVPWIASLWAILIFGACAAYYVIARREESPLHGYAPLWSLLIGYPLFVSWKAHMVLAQPDRMMANLIWAAGVGALAFGYADTARRRKMQSFAYLGALLLIASYTHLLTILDPHERHVERYALLVLPLLAGMYAYGVMRQTDEYAGRPFRRVAIGLSAAAILTSTLYGDHLLPTLTGVTDHTLITLTLSAYGAAYLAIALFRRTTGTIAAASSTQTLAYLHGLLSATPFWAGASARLNWAEFAALTAVAGAAWTALAWLFTRRLPDTGYARPLQAIAALLALLAAFTAWSPGGLAAADAGAGLWSLTALALCGAIWLALWGEEVGEPCWHIGAWNLLAAWALVIRLYLPADATHFDMNAAPLALYLLIAGHRVSQRGGEQLARGLWWIGLSLLMAPAYILFWGRAAGGHHVPLLIAECVLASLWGIVRRIRAYVSAGFGFIVLLTVSSWVRSINDAAGTVAALVIGVALFVFVYYWLTHRQRIENWLLRVSGAWRAWTAWR